MNYLNLICILQQFFLSSDMLRMNRVNMVRKTVVKGDCIEPTSNGLYVNIDKLYQQRTSLENQSMLVDGRIDFHCLVEIDNQNIKVFHRKGRQTAAVSTQKIKPPYYRIVTRQYHKFNNFLEIIHCCIQHC